jgi:hypothetical protein
VLDIRMETANQIQAEEDCSQIGGQAPAAAAPRTWLVACTVVALSSSVVLSAKKDTVTELISLATEDYIRGSEFACWRVNR